jgi:glycosyltransferase involved in cell wall biosynthesis
MTNISSGSIPEHWVLCIPSLAEGFGLPVLEAMACAAPVITSGVSSIPEIAGDAGLLVDPMDYESIACRMVSLATDGHLREAYGRLGIAQSAKFSWDHAAQETWKVLEAHIVMNREVTFAAVN